MVKCMLLTACLEIGKKCKLSVCKMSKRKHGYKKLTTLCKYFNVYRYIYLDIKVSKNENSLQVTSYPSYTPDKIKLSFEKFVRLPTQRKQLPLKPRLIMCTQAHFDSSWRNLDDKHYHNSTSEVFVIRLMFTV
jgi:hypothetical protein